MKAAPDRRAKPWIATVRHRPCKSLALAEHPQAALEAIYTFCELPSAKHDVENIRFDVTEFDARLGTPGLHDIRPKARRDERETILPPDLWQRWEGASIWRDPAFNKKGVGLGKQEP